MTTDFTDGHGWKRNCHLCSYPCHPCHLWLWLVAACRAAFSAVELLFLRLTQLCGGLSVLRFRIEFGEGGRLPDTRTLQAPRQKAIRVGILILSFPPQKVLPIRGKHWPATGRPGKRPARTHLRRRRSPSHRSPKTISPARSSCGIDNGQNPEKRTCAASSGAISGSFARPPETRR